MKTAYLSKCGRGKYSTLLKRPAINNNDALKAVLPIVNEVKSGGISAALKYASIFDSIPNKGFRISKEEMRNAGKRISDDLKESIDTAYRNIYAFHIKQKPAGYSVETMEGVVCSREFRPIENAGLYIPGGTAPLFSTLLMLAIPAGIAGCGRIALFSPAKEGMVSDALLYAASICGIDEFYAIGGAQAIALMAYGDKNFAPVNKIFGPGNSYVTAAKMIVSTDPDGCAIDMPAGPSEVLIIADRFANPEFVAADFLSQAEHGPDSQSVLVTNSIEFADAVKKEIKLQSALLDRREFIQKSLKSSLIVITDTIDEAIEFSNRYAPEHLIMNFRNAEKKKAKVINAGSVFIGPFSPESAGDYASGTNHSLPTYGYAKSYSGVTVEQFMKSVSFQNLSRQGLKGLAKSIITMAEEEKLSAHANAVKVRLK